MSNIKIIADSLSDISSEYAQKYDIDIVPLTIIFGDDYYKDGVDLTKRQFYEKLSTSEIMPKTSQINPAEFSKLFDQYPDRSILYVGASSKASGTYQSGVMAKEISARENIYTFDTMQLSMGSGLLVAEAAKLAKEGKDITQIIQRLEYMRANMQTIFTVDTLEFLERGGRISKTKSIIGTMLSIKPILTVEDGLVSPMDSVRGKKKVHEKVIHLIEKDRYSLEGETISLVHANCIEEMNSLKQIIHERFHPQYIIESEIGAGVGTHSGPGTVAVFYLKQ